jgi:transcriptional regulator with XRE-family HTH domain
MKTVRNRLRVLRAERRMNQTNAARRSRIGFNRYWRIENGYAEATPEERDRLARIFKVSVDEVFPPPVSTPAAPSAQETTL